MSRLITPEGYKAVLSAYDTQTAIGELKRVFESYLARALNLKRVTAPLFVDPRTGLNDDLSGIERPVSFDMKDTGGVVQIVQSLAKWKRMALKKYGFPAGQGIYTDMNAVRRDEELSNLHSVYVDQWDWERVISPDERHESFLRDIVSKIVGAIADTNDALKAAYPALTAEVERKTAFVDTQALEDMYPGLTPKEREDAFVKEHKTAFIMQIGDLLKSGERHDDRAPDYDDWRLNGDILMWNGILGRAVELSSMGIRVDPAALDAQLTKSGRDDRRGLPFHAALLAGELPLTIGGGIGQSRLCLQLLQKAHVGEVQVSVWDGETTRGCADAGIVLL